MKTIRTYWFTFLIALIILFIFNNWFAKGFLSAPDFPYYYAEHLGNFLGLPYAWSNINGLGYGGSTVTTLNIDTYVRIGIQVLVFGLKIPWTVASRIMFFWPFLIISPISAFFLTKEFVSQRFYALIGSLIYVSNTYILMLTGGGQMGLVMAYSMIPLVLLGYIRKNILILTIATYFLVLFDLRFAYLTAIVIFVYVLITISPRRWWDNVRWCIGPGLIIVGLHLFWIIPSIFSHSFNLPEGYGKTDWLAYLSWADFSKTLSLLHPNWPENIFGKTYFMEPQFILLPIVAFCALFSVKRLLQTKNTYLENKQRVMNIIFFSVLGLMGSFLAKGVNPPFGGIYEWMFIHIPMFNGFRDPTKFYVLTVLSYMVLIPFALMQMENVYWVKKYVTKMGKRTYAIPLLFVLYWIILLTPLWTGKVTGTFVKTVVPVGFTLYEKRITEHTEFSRTLVVPWRNRFVFESENHPIIDASALFQTSDMSKIAEMMQDPKTMQMLRSLAVSYVVIPDDFAHEIFLKDRQYDDLIRTQIIHAVDGVSYLDRQKGFDNLAVYKVNTVSGLFTRTLPNLDVDTYIYRKVSPVTYSVDVTSLATPVTLNFAMTYDPHWQLWTGDKIIQNRKTADGLSSFLIDSNVTRQVTLHYDAQRLVDMGLTASILVLFGILVYLYVRVSVKSRTCIYVHGIVILCLLGVVYAFCYPRQSYRDVSRDTAVWWSNEWKEITNPFTMKHFFVSRYGGSEIRFRITGTKNVAVIVSSSNNEKHIQGVDLTVSGKTYTVETPVHDVLLAVPAGVLDDRKTYDVVIRHWCAGTLWPCDMSIGEIRTDRRAHVSRPSEIPKKTLAILGDSIEVSFGNLNATYLIADRLGYHLHNASIFGSSTTPVPDWDSGLLRYKEDIVRAKPDVVIVFLGTNDLGHGIPVAEFQKNYEELVSGILQGSPHSKVMLVGLMYRKDYSVNQVYAYSDVIRFVAREHNVPYIDPYYWFTDDDLQDVVHPAPKSEQKFADKLFEAISPLLK